MTEGVLAAVLGVCWQQQYLRYRVDAAPHVVPCAPPTPRPRAPTPPHNQAFVLDSDPGTLPLDAERDVDSVLKQVERIPLPVPSRQWLLDHMQAKGFSMVRSDPHMQRAKECPVACGVGMCIAWVFFSLVAPCVCFVHQPAQVLVRAPFAATANAATTSTMPAP